MPGMNLLGGLIGVLAFELVSEINDKKKLESDATKNEVDFRRIFSRIITHLSLKGEQSVEMKNLKGKIESLDTLVQKLNNVELSRFEGQCINEMPALFKIQQTMLTPNFNVKNETLMELIELVVDNLTVHLKDRDEVANIDLNGDLETLKRIKVRRKELIKPTNKQSVKEVS